MQYGVASHVTSQVKNIQAIVDSPTYEAFGVPIQNQENQVTYYYRRGSTHLEGGQPYYRTLNITAGTWSDTIPIPSVADSLDCRGIDGGRMDNDSGVLFYTRIHTDGSRDIYIQKVDSLNNFSPPVLFDFSTVTQLQVGFFFGPMIIGDVPGEYYHIIYQFNVDTGASRFMIQLVKTTDYWNHYSLAGVIYDAPATTGQFSETAGANLGGGHFVAVARNNQSGPLQGFESTNYGATWVRRGASNLFWYNTGIASIPWIYPHDGVFDIPYENREAAMLEISKNNTLADNFGLSPPTYENQEIYSHFIGTVANTPALGYVQELKLRSGIYLMIYSHNYNNIRANIQWTLDDLVTDPNGIPGPPTLASATITTTTFRINISGYTDKQIENIRYFLFDVSTDPGFSTFVTAKYRNVSIYPAVLLQDIRQTGLFDTYSALTTGTTYYVRVKACNNEGCSAYTTATVTTL